MTFYEAQMKVKEIVKERYSCTHMRDYCVNHFLSFKVTPSPVTFELTLCLNIFEDNYTDMSCFVEEWDCGSYMTTLMAMEQIYKAVCEILKETPQQFTQRYMYGDMGGKI